jgi:enoyl-CoA hydratase/carnithine racemase
MTDVLYEVRDHVAWVTIHRPEARNSMNPAVFSGLFESWEKVEADPEVRVAILTGAGDKTFCAGGDLGSFPTDGGIMAQHHARGKFGDLFTRMRKLPKPIISAVNGYCLAGGMGLALACDFVIAAKEAEFGLPEIKRGLLPMMVMALLFRHVGPKKGLELVLTGERISSEEAQRLGIVNQVVPRADLLSAAETFANKIKAHSPLAVRLGKEAATTSADMEFSKAIEYLKAMFSLNVMTEDAMEGVAAFFEKRDPVWKGR